MTAEQGRKKRWRWYHGVLFQADAELLSYGLGKLAERATGNKSTREAQDEYFDSLAQPKFAPPGPTFPLAWAVNNAARAAGMVHVLNMPEGTPGRVTYLTLQGASLLNYASFNPLYFGLRSPVNGAVTTLIDVGLNAGSFALAVREIKDAKTAASLSTTLPWLALASAVSVSVALWNEDNFYGLS